MSEYNFYCKNKLHCNCGPAIKLFSIDGFCYNEHYYINGVLHNSVGPAHIRYSLDRKFLIASNFYMGGRFISKEIFLNNLERRLKC